MTGPAPRDHGGGIDAAAARYGGAREDWLDLSTGINPSPYPVNDLSPADWQDLPDAQAETDLLHAARAFWDVPDGADIVAAPGTSALIALIPSLARAGTATIPTPTYNEHAAAFQAQGWTIDVSGPANAFVAVNPNNPDGRRWAEADLPNTGLRVIDESFADIDPAGSLIGLSDRTGTLVLKSFGKFWGLAGLRLGFAVGDPRLIARLRDLLGPWAVSGPALKVGAQALRDQDWASQTRQRLARDAERLDQLMITRGAELIGGTSLFRLYATNDALTWQDRLACAHIWSRVFPYSRTWVRLGMPASEADWSRLETAL